MEKGIIGDRIYALCAQKGISISDLERNAGYSQGLISRWTSANRHEEFSTLAKLCAAADQLGVSIDTLLGREQPQQDRALAAQRSGGLCEKLVCLTSDDTLHWRRVDAQQIGMANGLKCPSGKQIAAAWMADRTVNTTEMRFLLLCCCDDLSDDTEPLSCFVYGLAGHKLPPIDLRFSDAAQELYCLVRAQESLS